MTDTQTPRCEHDLSEREFACVDGLCPLCLQRELAAKTAEAEGLRKDAERLTDSQTPRTDTHYGVLASQPTHHVRGTTPDIDFARTLERELASITAENEVLREQNFAMNKTIATARPGADVVLAADLWLAGNNQNGDMMARELLRLDRIAKGEG